MLFVGGGVAAFKSLPIEAFPDVTDTQVNVITLYPGRAAEEVEKQVTIPLEVALAGPARTRCACSRTRSSACRSSSSPSTTGQRLLRAPAGGRAPARGRPAGRGAAAARAAVDPDRRDLSATACKSDTVDSRELRTIEDWMVERQLRADSRRRRHRQPRRPHQAVRGQSRPREAARLQGHAAAAVLRAAAAATRTPAAATSSRAASST